MKVLLIWQQIPEETTGYILDGYLAELAIQSAGKYINLDDLAEDHPIMKLNNELVADYNGDRESLTKIDLDIPISAGMFEVIVVCGFIL